jgi:hypothetical protein
MALQKEQKLTYYQERIGVNNGSGFGDLAQASNREANNFDVIGNALSSKLLNLGQQIGTKEGETAAQTYNMKRGTRTVTDENGIEKEIDIVEPITAPKGLRTASQIEAFDTIMVKRYTKEVFSTLELETKKIYNDVKRNNGTAQDFESLVKPMFNAINENVPTNIQQAVTDYTDNLLISYGADIDELNKDNQFKIDVEEFTLDVEKDLSSILTKMQNSDASKEIDEFYKDLQLGIEANLITPDDAKAYRDAIRNEKLFTALVNPILDGSLAEQAQVLKRLQIIFGNESRQTSGEFRLSNGKVVKINKQDLLDQGITQEFLDKKVTRFSQLAININDDFTGSTSKTKFGPNGDYAKDNPKASLLDITAHDISKGHINPIVKNLFNNIPKISTAYIEFLNTNEYKVLKDSAKNVDGQIIQTSYIDNLGLDQKSINAFNEIEEIRLNSNISAGDAYQMFTNIKENNTTLEKTLENIGVSSDTLRETIRDEVGIVAKGDGSGKRVFFFKKVDVPQINTVSAYELEQILNKTIEAELLSGNIISKKNLEKRIDSLAAYHLGLNGSFGFDKFTADSINNASNKVLVKHPVEKYAGVKSAKIITSFVSGKETQVGIKTTENNVDYLEKPVMQMVLNSGEFLDKNGTLRLIEDKLKWGDNIKLTSVSSLGSAQPMYQIVYIGLDGETTGLTNANGLPLIINPFGSNTSTGKSLYATAQELSTRIETDWENSGGAGKIEYTKKKKEEKKQKIIDDQALLETMSTDFKDGKPMSYEEFQLYTDLSEGFSLSKGGNWGDAIIARFKSLGSLDIEGPRDLTPEEEYDYHVKKILPYGFVYVEDE